MIFSGMSTLQFFWGNLYPKIFREAYGMGMEGQISHLELQDGPLPVANGVVAPVNWIGNRGSNPYKSYKWR